MTATMDPRSIENQLPYYNEIHQYYLNLSNFLNITRENNDINKDRSKSSRAQKARAKLLKLSPLQFYELCTDVSDELNRRIRETGDGITNGFDDKGRDYLLPKSNYHVKRNQARQKLSNLSQLRFNDLIDDILFEIMRRDYHITDALEISNINHEDNTNLNFDTGKSELHATDVVTHKESEPKNSHADDHITQSMDITTDNDNTIDTNVSIPLPSMIQSSLIIPQKASIDWSDEDELDTKSIHSNSTEPNTQDDDITTSQLNHDNNHVSEYDNSEITEDIIKDKVMTNPFNKSYNDNKTVPQNDPILNIPNLPAPEISHTPIDRMDNDSSSIKQTPDEDITAPDTTIDEMEQIQDDLLTTHDAIPTEEPMTNNIMENRIDVTENVRHNKSVESGIEDVTKNGNEEETSKKKVEPGTKLTKPVAEIPNLTIPSPVSSQSREPSNIPPPSPVSHLQNELMSLNKQLTALSIENETLKTNLSRLEIINNSNKKPSIDHENVETTTGSSRNISASLSHDRIMKYITEDGMIPESLISSFYTVVNDLFHHIDNNNSDIVQYPNLTGKTNFGTRLFDLIDQFYKIILDLIELLVTSGDKDKIVLLKSTFSNLITTTKYFALYYHILPDIVIISSINECIFIILDIINMLKVKQDPFTGESSTNKHASTSLHVDDKAVNIPMTPLPKINTSNTSSEVGSLENSPVKPLKIIEKVASSPLINGNTIYEPKAVPTPLRKPSGNLLSLNNMMRKTSNENSKSKSSNRAETVYTLLNPNTDKKSSSTLPSVQKNKSISSSLAKKMNFSSSEESSESESDDDDTTELLSKLKQQKNKEINNGLPSITKGKDDLQVPIPGTFPSRGSQESLMPHNVDSDISTPAEDILPENTSQKISSTDRDGGFSVDLNHLPKPVSEAVAIPIKSDLSTITSDSQKNIPEVTENAHSNLAIPITKEASNVSTANSIPSIGEDASDSLHDKELADQKLKPFLNTLTNPLTNDSTSETASFTTTSGEFPSDSNAKSHGLSIDTSIGHKSDVTAFNPIENKKSGSVIIPTPSLTLNTKPSSPSLRAGSSSPSYKPIKITKLESSSLKRVDLSSKEKSDKNITGLGISLNKVAPASPHLTEKVDSNDVKETKANNTNDKVDKIVDPTTQNTALGSQLQGDFNSEKNTIDSQYVLIENIPARSERREVNKMNKEHVINENGSTDSFGQLNDKVIETTAKELRVNEETLKPHTDGSKIQVNNSHTDVEVNVIADSYSDHDELNLNSTTEEREKINLTSQSHHTVTDNIPADGKLDSYDKGPTDDSIEFISMPSEPINQQDKLEPIVGDKTDLLHEDKPINEEHGVMIESDEESATESETASESETETGTESETDSETDSETGSETDSDNESLTESESIRGISNDQRIDDIVKKGDLEVVSEPGSESESESAIESESEEDEEEEDDFDVDAFDIENPENTLAELLLYLEHQTIQVITTIQSLLSSIKEPKSTKGNLRSESNAINQVIRQMVGATSISMNQSRNANLKEHGNWVVQSLEDCSRRMLILCQLNKDGDFIIMDNDIDYADKNFKQRLAGIAFDIAKCTKELVKTVEEASLKEEIEYLNSKIHKK